MKKTKQLEKIQSNLFQDACLNNVYGGTIDFLQRTTRYTWIYIKGLTLPGEQPKKDYICDHPPL